MWLYALSLFQQGLEAHAIFFQLISILNKNIVYSSNEIVKTKSVIENEEDLGDDIFIT
jgi:hypothetical protein